MKKYSAKLLFQFRVDCGSGQSDIMRRCEERIIVLSAHNAKSALRKAKLKGSKAEFIGTGEAGNPIHFEFVGVLDLLEIGIECEPDEVWYNITTKKRPMERRDKIIPKEENLNALFWEAKKNKPSTRRNR
jgi:hypothetical protein